jgi:hypothetical protein
MSASSGFGSGPANRSGEPPWRPRLTRIRSLTIVEESDVVINLETTNSLPPGPAPGGVRLDGGDLHVLKLCLDLQLDALFVTVGAASSQSQGPEPPWRRWVNEDIQLAYALAADAQAGGAGPPSGLGSDLDRAVPSTTENGLHARYTSMVALLSGLISRPRSDAVGQEEQPYEWRSRAARALWHYQERLAELETHPWRPPPQRPADRPRAEHTYLPGELLG